MVGGMPDVKAPTSELGAPGITSGVGGWLDTWETTAELVWPNSVHVYDRMRKDGHIASGLRAITLPIRRTRWLLEEDAEVRPEVFALVRKDLGLVDAGRQRRRRQGIVWGEFLTHALLELPFGHMFFEQVYEPGDDGIMHLRKLGPRLPRTISAWDIAPDGGLNAIVQLVPKAHGMWREQRIPMDRMVAFVLDKEGSDWSGQSILREAYGDWLIKQGLVRVNAMAGERNGMGIPVLEYEPTRMTRTEALDIVKKVRAGEEAGLVYEQGAASFRLVGVEGQVRDILSSVKHHDQEMSRSLLAMFLDLGHDNGARSLGETFSDFFVLAQQAIADQIADVVTEHIIRDLVEINFGVDEPYPLLKCDEITADSAPTAEALKQLAEAGYIIPDGALEELLRRRYGFPISALPTARPAPVSTIETDDQAPTIEQLEDRLARLKAGPRTPPSRVASGT
jgi:hypothetical protein